MCDDRQIRPEFIRKFAVFGSRLPLEKAFEQLRDSRRSSILASVYVDKMIKKKIFADEVVFISFCLKTSAPKPTKCSRRKVDSCRRFALACLLFFPLPKIRSGSIATRWRSILVWLPGFVRSTMCSSQCKAAASTSHLAILALPKYVYRKMLACLFVEANSSTFHFLLHIFPFSSCLHCN